MSADTISAVEVSVTDTDTIKVSIKFPETLSEEGATMSNVDSLSIKVPETRSKPNWSAKDESKIRRVFDQCDEDKSGTVSLAELFSGLAKDKALSRTLGIPADDGSDEKKAEIEAIFKGLDTDGNAELDFEEFGYFFAERVEVLRYLPAEGADETQLILENEFEDLVRGKANELKEAFLTAIDAQYETAKLEVSQDARENLYEPLPDDIRDSVVKLVDAYANPKDIIPEMKKFGAFLARAGCDVNVVKAHYDAFPKALASVAGEWTVASDAAWTTLMSQAFDMVKSGFEEFAKAEREAQEAKAAEEAANAAKAADEAKAAEEARKAAESEKKKAEEEAKAAEKAAKQAKDEEEKAAASAAAKVAKAAKAAADAEKAALEAKAEAEKAEAEAAKKAEDSAKAESEAEKVKAEAAKKAAEAAAEAAKADAEKAEAEAAKKAAEEAKKAAQEEAKKKAAEIKAADTARAKLDKERNIAREKSAKAIAKMSEEEKAKAVDAKAAAEAAKAARQKREAEELAAEEAKKAAEAEAEAAKAAVAKAAAEEAEAERQREAEAAKKAQCACLPF